MCESVCVPPLSWPEFSSVTCSRARLCSGTQTNGRRASVRLLCELMIIIITTKWAPTLTKALWGQTGPLLGR